MSEEKLPPCVECAEDYTYELGALLACPMCGHEWSAEEGADGADAGTGAGGFKDAVGNPLVDGDDVTIIKDLKVKGASSAIKAGTKVKGIRLLEDPVAGHDIAAKVPGVGQTYLKTSVVKKA